MKIIAAVLFVTILTVYAAEESKLKDSLDECIADNGIKQEEFEELMEKDDPKLHCIMACLFEKEDMLKNGQLDRDAIIPILLKKNVSLSKTDKTKLVDMCMEKVKDIEDICDITNEFTKCMEKNEKNSTK